MNHHPQPVNTSNGPVIRWRLLAALLLAIHVSVSNAATSDLSGSVATWSFDSEAGERLETHGDVQRDHAGPRPPQYPDFSPDNTAVRFDGGYFVIQDPPNSDPYDFQNGDSITIEAWLNIDTPRKRQQTYIVGKGRTGRSQVARDNQNWALRAVADGGVIKASFLFATKASKGDDHWHRWTTDSGFKADSGWHHFAVTYKFGDPDSIRGYIDGVPSDGRWDMGGPTTKPPIVDEDEVWIGSAQNGRLSNSFRGWIDQVSIHRRQLTDEEIAKRFSRLGDPSLVGPSVVTVKPPQVLETMPQVPGIAEDQVRFSLLESVPTHDRWLQPGESWPPVSVDVTLPSFLVPRLPVVYDDWGIRRDWRPPVLARLIGDVQLPAGEHRVLIRTRSLARLWIDGNIVARNKTSRKRSGNQEKMTPVARPPMPDGRRAGFTQQETIETISIDASQDNRPLRVVLEWMVGGKKRRVQTGEVCVAIQFGGQGDFFLLTPSAQDAISLPLTDQAIENHLVSVHSSLTAQDDQRRRAAAASQDDYWQSRHELAHQMAAARKSDLPEAAADHPVDRFINAKIKSAIARRDARDPQTTSHFYDQVLPILRDECQRCHGKKSQGGLRLDSREAVLAMGDSELPAVVPGDLDSSELVVRIRGGDMPPTDDGLTDQQIKILEDWVLDGAAWPEPPLDDADVAFAPPVDDASWLRRVYLDTIGVPPTHAQADQFLGNSDRNKREQLVGDLLSSPGYADHWVSMWLDLLAENPTFLNVAMGSTGPFRWFLYDSLRDNKPFDRMVSELVLMRGSVARGGSAGFGLAGENDAPMAAKAHILASSFLGVEMGCARCHDAPYHNVTQEDLFSMAAMLSRKPITPPDSSRVPDAFFESRPRQSLIRVSLPPGKAVQPIWPLAKQLGLHDNDRFDQRMQDTDDSRERLALLITAPENQRFSRMIVNHLWKRLFGAGIVEPVHDWEGAQPSHPELLDWLSDELLLSGYDLKHVLKLMLTSDAYSRQAVGRNESSDPDSRFFAAPDQRRMSAEQVVDSLFVATSSKMDVEELTFVHDNSLLMKKRLSLGKPKRAWMFAGLGNERDRPSLSMPAAQAVTDVLTAFGWTGTRQQPIADRNTDPNVLQPGVLANGDLSKNLSRASWQSELSRLAIRTESAENLVDDLFLRFLTRQPSETERRVYADALSQGFDNRVIQISPSQFPTPDPPLPVSTWTNHLRPEANQVQIQRQDRIRRGPAADPRLTPAWREVFEDAVWSLINHREFIWIP